MIPENKISKFIALLIQETKAEQTKWISNNLIRNIDSIEGEQIVIGKIYTTKFKDKCLRLYKYSQPIQTDEFEYLKHTFFKLEFIDEYKNTLWSFPQYIRETGDLYETVQIKLNNIDKFFDEVVPDTDLW